MSIGGWIGSIMLVILFTSPLWLLFIGGYLIYETHRNTNTCINAGYPDIKGNLFNRVCVKRVNGTDVIVRVEEVRRNDR